MVTLRYDKLNFGPIYARDQNEVRNIFALFKDKTESREYMDEFKGHLPKKFTLSEMARKARKSLPSEVVEYLDKAFSKNVLKQRKYYSRTKKDAILETLCPTE